jgi:hypothetical protein
MNTRGWKWSAVGLVSLPLLVLGAHLAWEHHRCRLVTPRGAVRIGMTQEEVRAVLGKPDEEWLFSWRVVAPRQPLPSWEWQMVQGTVWTQFDGDGRVDAASFTPALGRPSGIPRPSLFEHVLSWLTGKKE